MYTRLSYKHLKCENFNVKSPRGILEVLTSIEEFSIP